jgi:transcriptional regulator with XRE-family HTH domain
MSYFNSNIRLLRERKKRTQSDIAVSLNLKRTTVNALEHAISQPTVSHLTAFSKFFGIAIDTLINVNMAKLSESQFTDLQNGFDVYIRGTNIRVIATTVNQTNEENIEFVSEKAKAGYTGGYADAEYIEKLPVFQLPFLSREKKYRAFSISGDSMLPIPDGSVVIGEYVRDFYGIAPGHAYIILTLDDGVVFKMADGINNKEKTLRLSSLNPAYQQFEVALAEVKEAWRFVCFMSNEIPMPFTSNDQLLRIIYDLQQDMTDLKNHIK